MQKELGVGLVYHYTSPEGALGILQNRMLWFTDCEFMNDPAELAYCHGLYDWAWIEACREFGVPEDQIKHGITSFANPYECRVEIGDALGFDIPARYYSFSTSFADDSVAMWSNYARGDVQAGYALGFDSEALEDSLRRIAKWAEACGMCVEVLAGKVLYDRDEQLAALKSPIRDYLAMRYEILLANADAIDQVMAAEISRGCHWSQVSAVAPFIKRPEFAYEQEYRFVLQVMQIDFDQKATVTSGDNTVDEQAGSCRRTNCPVLSTLPFELHFRKGFAGAVAPYFEVKLDDALVGALRVIKGNSYHNALLVKEGLIQLAKVFALKGVSIEISDVRLRA